MGDGRVLYFDSPEILHPLRKASGVHGKAVTNTEKAKRVGYGSRTPPYDYLLGLDPILRFMARHRRGRTADDQRAFHQGIAGVGDIFALLNLLRG